MTYVDLQEALHIFGLGQRATLTEIKERQRELVKRYHPDSGKAKDTDMIQKINAANRILHDYVSDYRFSFAEDEFYEQNPVERIRMQFMEDPICGTQR